VVKGGINTGDFTWFVFGPFLAPVFPPSMVGVLGPLSSLRSGLAVFPARPCPWTGSALRVLSVSVSSLFVWCSALALSFGVGSRSRFPSPSLLPFPGSDPPPPAPAWLRFCGRFCVRFSSFSLLVSVFSAGGGKDAEPSDPSNVEKRRKRTKQRSKARERTKQRKAKRPPSANACNAVAFALAPCATLLRLRLPLAQRCCVVALPSLFSHATLAPTQRCCVVCSCGRTLLCPARRCAFVVLCLAYPAAWGCLPPAFGVLCLRCFGAWPLRNAVASLLGVDATLLRRGTVSVTSRHCLCYAGTQRCYVLPWGRRNAVTR